MGGKWKHWTDEEIEWLREHGESKVKIKDLAKQMSELFGIHRSADSVCGKLHDLGIYRLGRRGPRTRKDQLCWDCKNCIAGCSWARDFEPVEGWTAEHVTNSSDYGTTYHIMACPEFERG